MGVLVPLAAYVKDFPINYLVVEYSKHLSCLCLCTLIFSEISMEMDSTVV